MPPDPFELVDALARAGESDPGRLAAVLAVVEHLGNGEGTPEAVLPGILALAVEHLGADRGLAWLIEDGEPRCVARRDGSDAVLRDAGPTSRQLLARCLADPKPVYSLDVASHDGLPGHASLLRGTVASLVAAPISCRGEVLGLLYVDTREGRPPLARSTVELLALFGLLVGGHLRQGRRIQALSGDNAALRAQLPRPFAAVVGNSPGLVAVIEQLSRLADADCSVLLWGETGVGKEVLVRALHASSPRADKPLVPVNCGALAESLAESELFGHARGSFTGAAAARKGLVEEAHQGTLFLDEIDSLSPALQVKLLRVLQEREVRRVGESRPIPVEFRLVAAAGRDLREAVSAGGFREDLYWRLATVVLRVPPLRERRADIAPLAAHFLGLAAARRDREPPALTPAAVTALERAPWPGNARQLEREMERALSLGLPGQSIDAPDLTEEVRGAAAVPGSGLAERVQAFEARLILDALDRTGGNLTQAAELLGLSRQNLQGRVRKHRRDGRLPDR